LLGAILGVTLFALIGSARAQTVIHERIVLEGGAPGPGAQPSGGPVFSVDSVSVGSTYHKVVRVNTPTDTVVSSRLQMSMAVPSGYGPCTFMVTDFPVGFGSVLWQRVVQGGQQSVVDTTFANRSMLQLVGHAVETDRSFNHATPDSIIISAGGDSAKVHIVESNPEFETFTALITVTLPSACVTPPHYRQYDSTWRNSVYDRSPKKIWNLGCALTCMAMAMTAFGDTVTPGELNTWMKGREVDSGGYSEDNINWEAPYLHSGKTIRARHRGIALETEPVPGTLKKKRILNPTDATQPAVLDSVLALCELAVVQVVNRDTTGRHWVLVTKKVGERFKVLDPGRNVNYLDEYGQFWRYEVFRRER
jgi:hypothetical protein